MDTSKVSVKLKRAAKDLGVDVSNLIMADLISIGYSEADAFAIVFPERVSVYSLQQIQSLRDGIVSSMSFKELVDRRKGERGGGKVSTLDGGDIELIDTTTTAKELLKVINSLPEASKERGQMLIAYSELLRKNSQQVDDEEDPIRIYIPQKCCYCTLYQDYMEEEKERKNKKKNGE